MEVEYHPAAEADSLERGRRSRAYQGKHEKYAEETCNVLSFVCRTSPRFVLTVFVFIAYCIQISYCPIFKASPKVGRQFFTNCSFESARA